MNNMLNALFLHAPQVSSVRMGQHHEPLTANELSSSTTNMGDLLRLQRLFAKLDAALGDALGCEVPSGRSLALLLQHGTANSLSPGGAAASVVAHSYALRQRGLVSAAEALEQTAAPVLSDSSTPASAPAALSGSLAAEHERCERWGLCEPALALRLLLALARSAHPAPEAAGARSSLLGRRSLRQHVSLRSRAC